MDRTYLSIVSGLPRSGTSMMMRMLEAGGIPVLTDNIRAADPSNPNGYYEFEPVKKTKEDPSWIPGAVGKVVKLVHLLLLDLPLTTYSYRVVFMHRNIEEVIDSQNVMLNRLGKKHDDLPKERLIALYRAQIDDVLRYLRRHRDHFSLLEIDYNAMIRQPAEGVAKVGQFFEDLDMAKMAAVVDPSLYRSRST